MIVHLFLLHGELQVFEWPSISSLIRSFFLAFDLLTQVLCLDLIFLKNVQTQHGNCIYTGIS